MKYLYLSSRGIEGLCDPKTHIIEDFMFRDQQFFCTKLEHIERNQLRFDFILKSYKFNVLLVDIKQKEINMFFKWKQRCFPADIETHVNIYETRDKDECLYLLQTDINLMVTGYFFKRFIAVLSMITPMTDERPV
jgi:hypothetical protein